MTSIEAILAPKSKSGSVGGKSPPAPVTLVYNLCAVLMAYAYTLRRMDIESLSSQARKVLSIQQVEGGVTSSSATPSKAWEAIANHTTAQEDNDDEPPPLEPNTPVTYPAIPLPPLSQPPSSTAMVQAHSPDTQSLNIEIFNKLHTLLPFLFAQPTPSATTTDPSRLILTSLEDATMWLISRLHLESELGVGGADALQLQLLEDLSAMLAGNQLVPTFTEAEEVESKYKLASKLARLPPQQAFAAAQTPLLLNAVADLYLYLEEPANLGSNPASSSSKIATTKMIKLTQRKLCFYVCSALLSDDATANRTTTNLRHEVQHMTEKVRIQIHATEEADKLAAAVNLLNNNT